MKKKAPGYLKNLGAGAPAGRGPSLDRVDARQGRCGTGGGLAARASEPPCSPGTDEASDEVSDEVSD